MLYNYHSCVYFMTFLSFLKDALSACHLSGDITDDNFAVSELPGMSLAAIHLTLNEPVHGTQPGKINKDLGLVGNTFRTTVK